MRTSVFDDKSNWKEVKTVLLDGKDITDDCQVADEERQEVLVIKRKNGNAYLENGITATEKQYGKVTIEWK